MIRRWRAGMKQANEGLRDNPSAYLTVHFFKRFFSGELMSAESDLRIGIGGILALLMLPGAILPLLLLPKYSSFLRWLAGRRQFDFNTASIPDKYMLLTLTMAITGIVAVLKWDGLFPDRLDYANLAPLPVRTASIFAAKFLALILFVGLFVFALNAASTILFPFVVLGDQTSAALFLRFILAHAVATVSGSVFMFCFFLTVAGVLMALLPYPWFRQITTAVQLVSLIALVLLLFVTPEIGSLVAEAPRRSLPFLHWLPTVWFLGLYQQVLGAADRNFQALATRAVEALGAALGASLLLYAASYWRHFRRIPQMVDPVVNVPGRMKRFAVYWLDRLALREPFDRACFHFAGKTLVRSETHRLLLAGFAGLGVAIAIEDLATGSTAAAHAGSHLPSATLLAAALAVTFFLLSGLRFVFSMPAELSANWAFQVAGQYPGNAGQRVARGLMLALLAPVVIVTGAVYSPIWGFRIGMAHAAFVLLASLLLVESLLLGYRKIPFACSYSAGKHNAGMVLALYFLTFLLFSIGLAHLERWALGSRGPTPFLALLALLAALVVGFRRYASDRADEDRGLIFKDEPEAVVASMDLH